MDINNNIVDIEDLTFTSFCSFKFDCQKCEILDNEKNMFCSKRRDTKSKKHKKLMIREGKIYYILVEL
jgi:hypothetical protein